ncbi:MAG: hydrogen gas-evolving membrane-bound hydrogenase subunit E [Planctomycetota bacterium]
MALALGPAGVFVALLSQLGGISGGEIVFETTEWVPGLGVNLDFYLDGLGLVFGLLISGIGTLIVLYASGYLKGHALQGRFYAYLLGFMTSMLGLVTADNILLLFIFWELTSITSYLLIGFDHDKAEARKSALQALVITGLGGLALLAGVILLALMADSWKLSEIVATPGLSEHPLYIGALCCLIAGAVTKSAQFPFHFWLPNAMAAPTPVSAYLHSSTMVKAGVYLIMRLNPAFWDDPVWSWTLVAFGGTTMVVGALLATREVQFKKILAYSTVSSLGIMFLFTGLSGTGAGGDPKYAEYGVIAGVGYLFAHALFKACLFLVAGTVTHETGVKDVEKLGGLFNSMKVTAVCGLVGGLSMAGVPPLMGFVGKELMLKGSMHPSGIGPSFFGLDTTGVITAAVFFSAAFTVMVSLMVGWRPFFSPKAMHAEEVKGHEPPRIMQLGPAVLAGLTIVLPWVPGLLTYDLLGAAVQSVAGVVEKPAEYAVLLAAADGGEAAHGDANVPVGIFDVFHPMSLPFALSILAIGVGAALYAQRGWWRHRYGKVAGAIHPIGPERNYERIFSGTMKFADWQTALLQNGYLRVYIKVVLVATTALLGVTLWRAWDEGHFQIVTPETRDFAFLEVVLLTMTGLAAVICTQYRSRLSTVAALGVVGFGVAMTFVLLGVPDIAMTQFAIETLTVIIFVLVVYHLPRFNMYSKKTTRISDSIVAASFGTVAALLVLLAADEQVPFERISVWMGEKSYTEAFGRNVVNVILVDFRVMDTMGEIVVLGIAAIGVYTLLRLRRGAVSELGGAAKPDPANFEDVIGLSESRGKSSDGAKGGGA